MESSLHLGRSHELKLVLVVAPNVQLFFNRGEFSCNGRPMGVPARKVLLQYYGYSLAVNLATVGWT